jgi:phosphatidylglycerol:prolipoprotein diacylglycerol transferase
MHPELFRIGSLEIHSYGVVVAIGFILGLIVAARRARSVGIPPELIGDLGVWLIITGMLGAKLFYVILFWPEFIENWRGMGLRSLRTGFVFYGGFIAACLATIVFARRKRVNLWKLADVLAPSVALGHFFGRLGCVLNGCCYGRACDLPWAVTFPAAPAHAPVAVHPTQLYEAAGNLAIFAGLSMFFPRRRFDGQVWWLYVAGYGALRFGIEFFRGDYSDAVRLGGFTPSQVVAACMIAIGLLAYRQLRRRAGRPGKAVA